jgi:hypothetical protein
MCHSTAPGHRLRRQLPAQTGRQAISAYWSGSDYGKSAFDDVEPYELTDLGNQFVHYAINEIVAKIE